MENEIHPDESMLNMYLDGELESEQCDRVKAHMAVCEACRAELDALLGLFFALEELGDIAPVPDLVPGVLSRVRPRRRSTGLKWLVPALQGAVALIIFVWGWSRLAGHWATSIDALPTATLVEAWRGAMEWSIFQGAKLSTWPARVWSDAWTGVRQLFSVAGPDFSSFQLVVSGAMLAILWLVCNALLVRRSLLNGREA